MHRDSQKNYNRYYDEHHVDRRHNFLLRTPQKDGFVYENSALTEVWETNISQKHVSSLKPEQNFKLYKNV